MLHGHGMDLADFCRGSLDHPDGNRPHGKVALEGVARLMGQHVHVGAGPVEVAEDKGSLIGRDAGHVAAHVLAGPGLQVKEPVFYHEIEEFPGLGTHLPVHGLGLFHQLFRCPYGRRISLREKKGLVVEKEPVKAKALSLPLPELFHRRGYDLSDLSAEGRCLLRSVVKALHVQIGQVRIGLKAHFFRHGDPERDQLVVARIQLPADAFVKPGPGQEGFPSFLPVRAFHVLQKAVEVALFSPELRRRCGRILLIVHGYLSLPDHLRNDPLVRGLKGCVHQAKELGAEFLLQVLPEDAARKGLLVKLPYRDQGSIRLPDGQQLVVVKGVRGIDGISDVADGLHGLCLFFFLLHLQKGASGLPVGLCL